MDLVRKSVDNAVGLPFFFFFFFISTFFYSLGISSLACGLIWSPIRNPKELVLSQNCTTVFAFRVLSELHLLNSKIPTSFGLVLSARQEK